MREHVHELRNDFEALRVAKLLELKVQSVKMLEIERLIYRLLNDGESLTINTLNGLFYHLRADYIEAVNNRKGYEKKEGIKNER